ncbi:MAG TPA: hypothetical protein VH092_09110, partial [Urbifossiella sp.]|nr:hypothetical protein [Urbifossiella sp.]
MPPYHGDARPVAQPLLQQLDRLLSDENSVCVLFDFVGFDLYALPLRRGPYGQISVCHTSVAYFVVENAWNLLSDLAAHHKQTTSLLHNPGSHPRFASDPPCFTKLPADQLRRELAALAGNDPAADDGAQPEPILKLDYATF